MASSTGQGFLTGTNTVAGAEVDAKIWTANRKMTNQRTLMNGARIHTIAGLIRQEKGNRLGVLNLITNGVTRTYGKTNGGSIRVVYPASYSF